MAGLPSVQKLKRDRLRAEAQPSNNPIKVETTAVTIAPSNDAVENQIDENQFAVEKPVEIVNMPVVETQVKDTLKEPVVTETDDHWKTEAKEFEHKWKSVSGKYERLKYDYQNLEEEFKGLKSSVEELKNNVSTKKASMPDPEDELTAEEEEAYKSAGPFVNKLVSKKLREMKESVVEPLRREIAELKNNSAKFSEDLSKTTDGLFLSHVKSRIPDLDQICSKTNQNWQDFAQSKIPYTNATVYDALDYAHKNRDLDTVVEIIDSFKAKFAPKSTNGLAALASPNLNSSAGTSALPKEKPMLKWSERKKASEDFRKGRINKQRLDQIDKIYKQAAEEKRINYEA